MFTRQYPCPFIIRMRPSYIPIPIYLQTVNRSFYKQNKKSELSIKIENTDSNDSLIRTRVRAMRETNV